MFDGLACWCKLTVPYFSDYCFPSQIIPVMGDRFTLFQYSSLWLALRSVISKSRLFQNENEKTFLYFHGLAIPSSPIVVFATYPLLAGIDKATWFLICFLISVTSILFQGTTLSVVAKCSGPSEKAKKLSPTDCCFWRS